MAKGILTAIPRDKYNELLHRIAKNDKVTDICKDFMIGYSRYILISNKEKTKIDEYRQEIALKLAKEFIPKAILKRSELLDNIDEKRIKGAKLSQLTASIHDLTIDSRLEAGQSTDNIAVQTSGLSIEDLKKMVLDGIVNDNNGCSPVSEVVECKQVNEEKHI